VETTPVKFFIYVFFFLDNQHITKRLVREEWW